jgi:hypothetical protein
MSAERPDLQRLSERVDLLVHRGHEAHARLRLLDITVDIAGVLSNAMIAIAAARLGEDELAKSSLRDGSSSLKQILEALREEHSRSREDSERLDAELKTIQEVLHGR